ncbi:hypothetical protein GCM10010512_09140 [Streptomyces thermoviolaceus subsp. thermoviolaceus]|nr:hypothetical protein GCM10010499_02480 [Streptomyces thermoviolaceus subsp. apingens]GHA80134.1 hypothetical protein GCM10010512_09140 [Streptomyces thermoviolaceus subsp. thermoviolaceus]
MPVERGAVERLRGIKPGGEGPGRGGPSAACWFGAAGVGPGVCCTSAARAALPGPLVRHDDGARHDVLVGNDQMPVHI